MLETYEVAAQQAQQGSVIWLHGLGASNHDFDDLVPMLALPTVRFVFPAAPRLPVTINGGMVMPAWYDILSFSDPPLRENEPDVRTSALQIEKLLDREVARGVAANRIVLMGFSQGGAMALHTGLRYRQPLAGIAALSAYLLLPGTLDEERSPENEQTPLLFAHGQHDPIVPFELGRRSFEAVRRAGYAAEFHAYPMQHSISLPEVELLRDWLKARFFEPGTSV